jgi:hypothetical protein
MIERKDLSIPGRGAWSRLSPLKSLRLRNHSPDGFEWGYEGSGPAQTALALLLDFTRDRTLALLLYQDFKSLVVARLAREWILTGAEISEAVLRIRAARRNHKSSLLWLVSLPPEPARLARRKDLAGESNAPAYFSGFARIAYPSRHQ